MRMSGSQLLPMTSTSSRIGSPHASAGQRLVQQTCASALAAFDSYRNTAPVQRADLLDRIADNVEALSARLVELMAGDTGLGLTRAMTTLETTVAQLRFFGDLVRSGNWMGLRVERTRRNPALISAPDIRQRSIAIGPVAVLGSQGVSSVFSMVGDGTASALAAGCPVLVVAPSAHPELCRIVAMAVRKAVIDSHLHEAVFSMLHAIDKELENDLVSDHRIEAVLLTGTRSDALTLNRIAAARQDPIQVYWSEYRFKPLIILPAALAARGDTIGHEFAASMATTNGAVLRSAVVLVLADVGVAAFTGGIERGIAFAVTLESGSASWQQAARCLQLPSETCLTKADDAALYTIRILRVDTASASEHHSSKHAIVVIACADIGALQNMFARLGALSSVTVQMDEDDLAIAQCLLPQLEKKTDRIHINNCSQDGEHSEQLHASPFANVLDARSISMGNLAIARFLRPVMYQGVPDALLPESLKDTSGLWTDGMANPHSDFSAYILEHAKSRITRK